MATPTSGTRARAIWMKPRELGNLMRERAPICRSKGRSVQDREEGVGCERRREKGKEEGELKEREHTQIVAS